MKIEFRDVITVLTALIAFTSMLVVSRNARRATSVQTENTDLARIRDLRSELRETKEDLDRVKGQISSLTRQLQEASEAAMESYRVRAEMLRFARMPGMDMDTFLARFDPPAQLGDGRMDS